MGMSGDDFREMALSLPDAIEGAHMGHPDFRANGRIFATLHPGEEIGMVKLTPEQQAVLLDEHRKMFVPSAGAWGRQGCTNVTLKSADKRTVRAALTLAWENVSTMPPPKSRPKRKR